MKYSEEQTSLKNIILYKTKPYTRKNVQGVQFH